MYKSNNFAQVDDTQDFNNPFALNERKIYIEYQMNEGFSNDLIMYQNENPYNKWNDLVAHSQKLVELTREVYNTYPNQGYVIFQLEQVLGRVEWVFKERKSATADHSSQEYLEYQNNLSQLESLSQELTGHKSIIMKNLGITLVTIGILIAFSALLITVLSLTGVAITLSLTGAAIIAVVGLIMIGGGLLALYKQQQSGLSLAVSTLVHTSDKIRSPLEYFDNCVSLKLYKEDFSELREKLLLQLNDGFDPLILTNALIWATRAEYISNRSYEEFFTCIADICCKFSYYWMDFERKPKKSWPDTAGKISNERWLPINSKDNFFAKNTSSAVSTIKLFDEFTTGKMSSEDQITMREGIQRLINNRIPPNLIQNAIIWAKTRYEEKSFLSINESIEEGSKFFDRIAVICGVALAPKVLKVLSESNISTPQF